MLDVFSVVPGIVVGVMVMILFGWLSVFFYRKQLLMSLLSLEMLTLGLFMSMALGLMGCDKSVSLSFFMLVLGACEASLGLVIMVNMARLKGSDMLSMVSLVKC